MAYHAHFTFLGIKTERSSNKETREEQEEDRNVSGRNYSSRATTAT